MLLRVREVAKRYGEFVALRDVSFDISKDEVVAIVGPNGAGKTTLVNTLAGLHLPTSGKVLFEGRPVDGLGAAALAKRGLVRSFQLVSIFPTFTVADMIAAGAFSAAGRTFSLFRPSSSFGRHRREVEGLAASFGLLHRLDVPCRALSQGEKKLVDIASALALRPRLMLLDEPTSGISSADKYRVMDTLLAAAKGAGVESLVLVEHDMELIARYATRVIGIRAGSVVADLPPKAFFANPDAIDSIVGKVPGHARH